MGNCLFNGIPPTENHDAEKESIPVVPRNDAVAELHHPPDMAECVTNEVTGHSHHSYPTTSEEEVEEGELGGNGNKLTPGRMMLKKGKSVGEVNMIPRYSRSGVWKVKLMISAGELASILAEESRTEEFIQTLRTVARA